jgi:DNA-binding CsgD family transcriptional regulator
MPLGPRQFQAVALASEGLSNAGIAERMQISAGSVKNLLMKAAGKLQLQTETRNNTRVLLTRWYLTKHARPQA